MPDYVIMSDLSARLPSKFLIQALDDDRDGVSDAQVFTEIQKAVKDAIDSRLGQSYDPADYGANPPAIVRHAGTIFALEICYQRRGVNEKNNPHTKEAEALRKKLDAIGTGKEPLVPEKKKANPSGGIITEDAKTVSKSGRTS